MKKTKKMLEVEAQIDESLEGYLHREYFVNFKSAKSITEELNVTNGFVSRLLKKYNIKSRNLSEAMLKGKKRPSKRWLEREYVEKGRSATDIAEEVGVTYKTVNDWLKKDGIELKTLSEIQLKGKEKPSKEWLEREYVKNKRSTYDIAEEVGVCDSTVGKWIKNYGIKTRDISEAMLKGKKRPSKRWLEREYVEKGRSANDIAEEVGVSCVAVSRWIKDEEIKIRSKSEIQLKGKKKPSKEWLEREYIEKVRSANDIAEELNVTDGTVGRWLKKDGIELRTLSEALLKGKKKPSREWLYEQHEIKKRSSYNIGKEIGVSGSTVIRWLKEEGFKVVPLVDRINKLCNDRKYREEIINGFLEELGKKPEQLTITDFCDVGTKRNGGYVSAHSVLNWYARQHNCKGAEARDILVEDLYNISRVDNSERLEKVIDGFLDESN